MEFGLQSTDDDTGDLRTIVGSLVFVTKMRLQSEQRRTAETHSTIIMLELEAALHRRKHSTLRR